MDKRNNFLYGLIAGLGLALVVMLSTILARYAFFGARGGHPEVDRVQSPTAVSADTLSKLEIIEGLIKENYALDMVDDTTLESGAFRGMIAALGDPYSAYFSQEEMSAQQDKLEGVYYGIGAYVSKDEATGYGVITKVMDDSPSLKAGLMDGDLVKEVDGKSTAGLGLDEIVAIVRGEKDTKVVLTILRGPSDKRQELKITVKRGSVPRQTVYSELLEDDIAYIRIAEFDSVTVDQFIDALATMKGEGMKALVLDLRENPGGNFNACISIGRRILPKGLITYTKSKSGEVQEYTCDGQNELEVPLAVLVDKSSASASEILAGAIKDHKKGVLVGTTTYGKGIVQRYIGLTDGSAVKLTTSKYYTPNGENIHGIGIKPDIEIEFDRDLALEKEVDNQLEKALEHLKKELK